MIRGAAHKDQIVAVCTVSDFSAGETAPNNDPDVLSSFKLLRKSIERSPEVMNDAVSLSSGGSQSSDVYVAGFCNGFDRIMKTIGISHGLTY